MDWDEQLFSLLDDLEHQAQVLYDADRAEELADRSRSEYVSVTLVSRLMASVGDEVAVDLLGVGTVSGRLRRVGTDWCLVHGAAQDWVVRLAAIRSVEGASPRAVPEVAWSPISRLGLRSALRRLADTGAECRLHAIDGSVRYGRITRVGADFSEVQTAPGRRALVSTTALAGIQSRDG